MLVIMNDKDEFYAIDYRSGGYGYFTTAINYAKMFKSRQDALEVLEDFDFTEESVMADGTKYPPRLVQDCCDINKDKLEGECVISICEIQLTPILKRKFSGKIQKPKGYTY